VIISCAVALDSVYISTNGIDNDSCGTVDHPCLSLKFALSLGPLVIRMASGTYRGENNTHISLNGAQHLSILGNNAAPGTTLIDCAYSGSAFLLDHSESDVAFADLTFLRCGFPNMPSAMSVALCPLIRRLLMLCVGSAGWRTLPTAQSICTAFEVCAFVIFSPAFISVALCPPSKRRTPDQTSVWPLVPSSTARGSTVQGFRQWGPP